MRPLVLVAVPVAAVVAWRLVAAGRTSVWRAMAPLFAAAGLLALALGPGPWSTRLSPAVAAGLGLIAGAALWGATLVFVALVAGWPAFARHTAEVYDQRKGLSLGAAVAIACLVVAPGEEFFWRGLFLREAAAVTSPLVGAVLSWAGYVAANAASGSLPITAAAVVAGGAWSGLAWITGGLAAPLACHVAWTGLMLARPPREAATGASPGALP